MDLTENGIRYWLLEAYHTATLSPDPSTQNGAILLDDQGIEISRGFNGFTKGIDKPEVLSNRELKYLYVEHAERNALYGAVEQDLVINPILVCPWAACVECARAIVQSGVRTLVRHAEASLRTPERWRVSSRVGDEILRAGDVEIVEFSGFLDGPQIIHCGTYWTP